MTRKLSVKQMNQMIGTNEFNVFKEEMEKKLTEKEEESTFEKQNQFK
jgi:hypothetical protein